MLLGEKGYLCVRGQITERLGLRGLSKAYLRVERGRAKFSIRIYLMEVVSGRERINVGDSIGRDEVLANSPIEISPGNSMGIRAQPLIQKTHKKPQDIQGS